jgi:hypothetical protein
MNNRAMGTKELNVILAVINIILLITVIVVWLNTGKEEKKETAMIGESEVGIGEQAAGLQFETKKAPLSADVKLCSSFDDNYNCEEADKFRINSAVYMLFSVSGFGQADTENGWLTGIRVNVNTTDDSGKSIESMTGLLFDAALYNSTEQNLRFSEYLSTLMKISSVGNYNFEFEITDMITGETITKTIAFEMER